jgi:glycosyltransferase involved in cell wall biosynthesis
VRDLGHDVAISAFWGLEGSRLTISGMRVYPKGLDGHGNDVIELHATDFFGRQKDGLVLPLTDIWVMQPDILRRLNVACWVPVDHEPCQPPTVNAIRKGRCIPIAMSRFGERMLQAEGFDPVYVPHGVETGIFTPLDRNECRRQLGLPESAFLVGMVAANQGQRKSFPQAVRAFARFRQAHPEAMLYLHTWMGPHHQGLDLHDLLALELPGEIGKRSVRVCDQYEYATGIIGDDRLSVLYGAMDVLMNPAQGEGFGVAIIEAQACGVPVILTNCTSMTELCGSGYLVGGAPVWTSFSSWQLLPDADELTAALEAVYNWSGAERDAQRAAAREFALGYDCDLVTEQYWKPALEQIEQRAGFGRKPSSRRKAVARR